MAVIARVPNVQRFVACRWRVGQTCSTPSSLALLARPAPPARGLDWVSLARRGLLMAGKAMCER